MLIAKNSRTSALAQVRLGTVALVIVCIAVLAACGKKEAAGPQGMGPLAPFLDIGTRGMWTGEMKDGVYSLSNDQESRALRTITLLRTDEPKYSVGVDISFAGPTDGVAGLVFSHNAPEKHYFLLSMQPDGRVALYSRTADSLTQVLERKTTLKPGFNRLSFEGEGNSVDIKLNGEKIATHVAQGLSEGGAGIAALGKGKFEFTNFAATGYKREPPPAGTEPTPGSAPPKPNG